MEYARTYEAPHGFEEEDCKNCNRVKLEFEFRACQTCRSFSGVILADLRQGVKPNDLYIKGYSAYAKILQCEPALTRIISS